MRELENLALFLASNGRSHIAETRAVRDRLKRAQASLPMEIKRARAMGFAVTPSDMERSLPPPDRDAALDYVELTSRWQARPIPDSIEKLYYRSGPLTRKTDELAKIETTLQERNDLLELVHAAVNKPKCVFRRDWTQGAMLALPEYTAIRHGVRLLRGECLLESRRGNPLAAITHMKGGFQIARHVASENIAVAHLVAIALEAITIGTLREIMLEHPDDERVLEAVSKTLRSETVDYDLALCIKRENIMPCSECRRLAASDSFETFEYLTSENQTRPRHTRSPFPGEPQLMKQLFEAVLAHYLHSQGPVLAAARLEPRVRLVEFRRMARKKPRPRLPDRLSDIFIADWGPVCEGYLGIQGRRATTEAGAAILLSRKRHGRLPDNLTDIVRPFVDPFTNRPVKCRREGRNGFVVYSVGVSGKFDGGKPGDKPSSKEHPFRFP